MIRSALIIPTFLIASACEVSSADPIKGGWTICTRDLQLRETLIERANERELILINAYGIRSVLPMDEVLFVVKSEADPVVNTDEIAGALIPEPSPVRLISLTDGQTIRANILEPDLPEDLAVSLIAGNTVYGDATLPLERVLSIRDQSIHDQRGSLELIDDLAILRNGDRVTGFFESIGPSVRLSLHDSEIELDSTRIEQMYLANEPAPEDGLYLRFADREIIRVLGFRFNTQGPTEISVDAESLGLLDTGNTQWRFESRSLDSLWMRERDQRVLALTSIEPERVEPTGDREWVQSPTIITNNVSHQALESIDFRSPVRVYYPLPEGASRFACTLEAPIEVWTDCIARIIVDRGGRDRQLFEQRLHKGASSAEINIDLPVNADSIIIEIDPGEHGPIQDRVIMHRPRVLIVN